MFPADNLDNILLEILVWMVLFLKFTHPIEINKVQQPINS